MREKERDLLSTSQFLSHPRLGAGNGRRCVLWNLQWGLQYLSPLLRNLEQLLKMWERYTAPGENLNSACTCPQTCTWTRACTHMHTPGRPAPVCMPLGPSCCETQPWQRKKDLTQDNINKPVAGTEKPKQLIRPGDSHCRIYIKKQYTRKAVWKTSERQKSRKLLLGSLWFECVRITVLWWPMWLQSASNLPFYLVTALSGLVGLLSVCLYLSASLSVSLSVCLSLSLVCV